YAVRARTVAVVIPAVAATLLIAPYALRAPWAAGPAAAIAVSALCGLGVALTPVPEDTFAAEPIRAARRIVVAISIFAGAAGLTGALATKTATLGALGAMMLTGLIAAVYGVSRPARVTGWLVATSAGQVFALVAGSIAGFPAYLSAFLVGAVAGGLLVIAS